HALGGDHELLARQVPDGGAQSALGGAAHVDVGGVEQVDAELEGAMDDAGALGFVHRAAVGGPRSERDFRNLETAATEGAMIHVDSRSSWSRGPGFLGTLKYHH